jgi:hypothetical protein
MSTNAVELLIRHIVFNTLLTYALRYSRQLNKSGIHVNSRTAELILIKFCVNTK